MLERIVLGLGSNKGLSDEMEFEPVQILKMAVIELQKIFLPKDFFYSSVYKSKAMYYEDQSDFFNMVVSGFYDGTPQELLHQINEIEATFGRNRLNEFRNGPRTLDIDIELFGEKIVSDANLEIPHKKIKERQFVLIPLLEIFPKCAEPISGVLFSDILAKLPDQGVEFFCKLDL